MEITSWLSPWWEIWPTKLQTKSPSFTGAMSYSSEHVINRRSVRYALAIVVVAAAFLIRLAMNRLLGAELPPFITLFPAIFFAAIRFGLGPGILASVLSAIATE